MKFSERIGKTEPRTVLQVDEISPGLRNLLWNRYLAFKEDLEMYPFSLQRGPNDFTNHIVDLWTNFFKRPLDEIQFGYLEFDEEKVFNNIRKFFFNCSWFEVYDFLEFSFTDFPETQKSCNVVLKKEMSAYRFIEGTLVQVTSEEEIAEIENALINTDKFKSINDHLDKSLRLLGDKISPDYHNSIKESISAVEACLRLITNDNNDILSTSIKKVDLHPAFTEAIIKLYAYASDQSGVRHSHKEGGKEVQLEDARFILIVCSAIINFLKDKLPN